MNETVEMFNELERIASLDVSKVPNYKALVKLRDCLIAHYGLREEFASAIAVRIECDLTAQSDKQVIECIDLMAQVVGKIVVQLQADEFTEDSILTFLTRKHYLKVL